MMAMCSGAEIASLYVFQRAPNARYSCRQKQVEIAVMLKRDAVVDVFSKVMKVNT
jgi:DNA helicase IV